MKINVIYPRSSFSFRLAVFDLVEGLRKKSVWMSFAWDEIQQRYRRSYLGLAWIVVSYLLFVAAIAIFFGGFSGLDGKKFTAHVALNYAIFNFLIASLSDGCDVFRSSRHWLKSSTLPHSIYVYKSIARSLFVLFINLCIAMIIVFLYADEIKIISLLSIPALIILIINAVWVQMILGYLASRYRDLTHFIQSISRVLFFITPVLWVFDERTGIVRQISNFNPFTHALEIFSAPLLGHYPSLLSWGVILSTTLCGFVVTIAVTTYAHSKLAFWL